jgi:hypothetical protein
MERDALDAGAERFGVELQTYVRTLILAAHSGELPVALDDVRGRRELMAIVAARTRCSGKSAQSRMPQHLKTTLHGLSPWSPTPKQGYANIRLSKHTIGRWTSSGERIARER